MKSSNWDVCGLSSQKWSRLGPVNVRVTYKFSQ